MDKTQLQALLTSQVKIIYSLLAALGLIVLAVLDYYQGQISHAVVAAGFSLCLVAFAVYLLWHRQKPAAVYPEWGLVILFSAFTLFGIKADMSVVHWLYFVPIYTYFLIPFLFANIILGLYSLALFWLVLTRFPFEQQWTILFTYSACFIFSLVYAWLNYKNNKELAKMVNTDPSTQLYNEHQLQLDLNKELIRANRQATRLDIMLVQAPKDWSALKLEHLEHHLAQLARSIRKVMREYDSCYRLDSNHFLLLLPQAEEEKSKQLLAQLQQVVKQDFSAQIIFKLDCLTCMPEDEVDSLLRKVEVKLNAE